MIVVKQLASLALVCVTFSRCQAQSNPDSSSRAQAESIVARVLADTAGVSGIGLMIKDEATAVAVAEPILFGIYGREKILHEKPYVVYQIKEHWYLAGTLPRRTAGGCFEMVLDARDARVRWVTHYK